MRKTQRSSSSVPLSVKLPPKRIREKFLIIYELEGCQKAVNFLTEHYEVRKMRIVLDGKKVGKKCVGFYLKNTAFFGSVKLSSAMGVHVKIRLFEC